jgi:hypothetical protein
VRTRRTHATPRPYEKPRLVPKPAH